LHAFIPMANQPRPDQSENPVPELEPQQEPPRPHGDKLDDEVGHERTGDMDMPAMNPTGEDNADQD
jgi:hypothetical protein